MKNDDENKKTALIDVFIAIVFLLSIMAMVMSM